MSSMGVLSGLLRFATPSLTHSTSLAAALSSVIASPHRSYSQAAAAVGTEAIQWVFLGAPGVGKGTYASRAAKHFNVAHIATGDLIREEIKAGSALGKQLLQQRLASGKASGEKGYILDGFPRTRAQAEKLAASQKLQVAFNLGLREEVLVEKCLGRRSCSHCGKGYNIADIRLPASTGKPEIVMPPLSPPAECAPHLEIRADDTEPIVRRRLEIYKQQAVPVEDFFRASGLLADFEITGGIPETLPSLLASLQRFVPKNLA